ncbi:hypothetical protein C8T65DRAFT_696997 [Cerioporus squamosus]|nr:hypothetical protein C8T65DRAFT_696997 [Cerioporus squamosus]
MCPFTPTFSSVRGSDAKVRTSSFSAFRRLTPLLLERLDQLNTRHILRFSLFRTTAKQSGLDSAENAIAPLLGSSPIGLEAQDFARPQSVPRLRNTAVLLGHGVLMRQAGLTCTSTPYALKGGELRSRTLRRPSPDSSERACKFTSTAHWRIDSLTLVKVLESRRIPPSL